MSYCTTAQVYAISGLTSSDVASANVTAFIGYAQSIVDSKTGYYYSGTANVDEFKNVELKGASKSFLMNSGIPEYAYDYDQLVYRFNLNRLPVNRINSIFVTSFNNSLSQVWSLVGSTYSDVTDDVNTEYADTTTLFPTGASSDVCYIGCENKFSKFEVEMFTAGTTGTLEFTYYNGSSWTSLTVTDNTSALTSSGAMSFDLPADMSKVTINSKEAYYVKITVGTGYDINPIVTSIVLDNDYVIYGTVSLKSISYNDFGEVVFNDWVPEQGFRKLKFNYNYGSSTVPSNVEQLTSVIAGEIVLGSLIGATYDDLTSGSKADEQWATGEQYINIKNAIAELRLQEKILWRLVNKKIVLEVV